MRSHRARCATAWLAAGAAALLWAPAALATSVYRITGGEVIVTASAGGVFLADPLELPVDGSSIEVDLTPGSEQIVGLEVTATGPVQAAISPPLGVYDAIVVDSLILSGGPGQLFPLGPIPPDFEYFALIDDVVLDLSFALIDDMTPGPQQTLVIPLGQGTGSLFVSLAGPDLTLTGVVENSFDLDGFGPITIKTDVNFSAVLIPEPAGALVFAIGLLPVARAVRRGRTTRS